MGTCSGAYELNHKCASMSDLITRPRSSTHGLINRVKSWVQMFYFDSNTFVPLKCDALVFL